jgi:hypothetical protein
MKTIKIGIAFLLLPMNLWGLNWQTYGLYKTSYIDYRNTLFNPNNLAVNEIGLVNRDLYFSQYANLQTKLLSADWRIDLLGTSSYEKEWDGNLRIKQFYVQKDLFQNLGAMVGRILLNWGTGYAFNPANVVAPQKELSDPDNVERRLSGNDLAKLEYFGESYSLALVYLSNLKLDKKVSTTDHKLAFRFYKNFWGLDLSLISLFNQAEKSIIGSNFAYVIGERLEIHGEFAAQKGSYQPYHQAITNADTFYFENPLQLLKRNEDRFFNQYLIGINYTLPKNISWILEYYHRDQGYSKGEWKRVIDHVKFVSDYFETPFGELTKGNLLWSLNVFSSSGAMQDYLMSYINIPVAQNLELKSTTLINLIDRSFVSIPEIDITIKNRFTFYGRSFIFEGTKNSEYGELFQSFSIEGGVRFNL